jgi:hypothetical protein
MATAKSAKPSKKSTIEKSRATKSEARKAMQKTIARYGSVLKELARR